MKRTTAAVVALACMLTLLSCGGSDDSQELLVMAAASLSDAFTDIEQAFEATHPDIEIQLNLAGSAALREQILEGAPADIFASANQPTMDVVIESGAAQSASTFARNELHLAYPVANSAGVSELADLADDSLLVGLCAAGVPCGDFARQALQQAGVQPSIDTNENDVRALLTKLEAGELDAGIVYATDVASTPDVSSVAMPSVVDVAIEYPIAVLTESADATAAQTFVDFVQSAEGQAILAERGFLSP